MSRPTDENLRTAPHAPVSAVRAFDEAEGTDSGTVEPGTAGNGRVRSVPVCYWDTAALVGAGWKGPL